MQDIDPRIIRQIFVLLLITLIGGLIFREIAPYFSGVLGAITLYVLFKKTMDKLVRKGWPPNLAATVLMITSFIVILLPVSSAILMLGSKIGKAVKNSEKVVSAFKIEVGNWKTPWDTTLLLK